MQKPYPRARTWLFGLLLAGVGAATSHATTIETVATSFTGDPIEVKITFDDAAADPGDIWIGVEVLGDQEGDLRGLFLNLSDDSLIAALEVTGSDVTRIVKFDVMNIGLGVNLNGGGGPCPCDLGIRLGTPGMGRDDIQSTSLVLSHPDEDLSLSLFQNELVGVRVTSVEVGGSRNGSSKTVAVVPEPMTAGLVALGLIGLAAAGPRRSPPR